MCLFVCLFVCFVLFVCLCVSLFVLFVCLFVCVCVWEKDFLQRHELPGHFGNRGSIGASSPSKTCS